MVGKKLSSLSWLTADGGEAPASYPWDAEVHGDLQLRGVPMKLRIGMRDVRRVNVNVSPIFGADAKRRGVLVTFDDQTAVEEDNLQLSRLLSRFGDAGDQISLLRQILPSEATHELEQLDELAQSARELAKLCAESADARGAVQSTEETLPVPPATVTQPTEQNQ